MLPGVYLSGASNFQVKALSGPNVDFIFSAVGQGQRNVYPGTTYGGVLFGYSAKSIRIFVPANETGTRIQIPENWGTTEYSQMSDDVEIIVTIWKTASFNLCKSIIIILDTIVFVLIVY